MAGERAAFEAQRLAEAERLNAERDRIARETAERDRLARERREADAAAAAESKRAAADLRKAQKAEALRLAVEAKAERRREKEREREQERAAAALAQQEAHPVDSAETWPGFWGRLFSSSPRAAAKPLWDMPLGAATPRETGRTPVAERTGLGTVVSSRAASATMNDELETSAIKETPLQDDPPSVQPTPSPVPASEPAQEPEPTAETPRPDAKGRAARLLAEDAADQRAQRFKNYAFGETPEAVVENERPATTRLMAEDAADQKAQRFKNYAFADATEGVPEPERPAPVKKRRGSPVLVLLLVVIVAGLAVTPWLRTRIETALRGGSAEQPQRVQAILPAPAAPVTETAALNARIAELEQKLAAATRTPSGAAQSEAPAPIALNARVTALETGAGSSARLDDLSNRIAALEGKSANANSVLALTDRVEALEKANRQAAAAQVTAVALLTAVNQLHDAIAVGRPFALELETAKALAGRAGVTLDDQGFGAFARSGVPTIFELQRRFERTAPAIVRADILPADTANWLKRILNRALSIVTIRRTDGDVDGTDVPSVLARAERRLNEGDLARAVTEMSALSGNPAQAASEWVRAAEARVGAERAVTDASAKAIGALAAQRAQNVTGEP
ncbi:MAG: mitofilin family membrane protein [Candidatus Binataceae bacterium]